MIELKDQPFTRSITTTFIAILADTNINVQCDEENGEANWYIRYRSSATIVDKDAPGANCLKVKLHAHVLFL